MGRLRVTAASALTYGCLLRRPTGAQAHAKTLPTET
jgi:hypothetical protein